MSRFRRRMPSLERTASLAADAEVSPSRSGNISGVFGTQSAGCSPMLRKKTQ
ncbi:hypothetical protein KIN20_033243 [Parelaphostrongylus tenuis]|uniref:Uncharacterized protein n=1 Tax=Parelaphostrongylus tenuis TaxID=148309 RepID=A0AAD5R843_PARTN|nr:hypothetical protein KIN20_033243 [Parelaphostrongylus tenuis]